jgi:hypothetical protein
VYGSGEVLSMITEPKKLNLMPYNVHNSIVVIAKDAGANLKKRLEAITSQ